jgi:hypothetical protein
MRIDAKLEEILAILRSTMRKRLTSEERAALRATFAELRADLAEIRAIFERALARMAETEAADEHRRNRLRRMTFGILGRT